MVPILTPADAPTVRTILGDFAPDGVTDDALVAPAWTLPVEQELLDRFPDAAYAASEELTVVRTAAAYLLAALIVEGQRRVTGGSLGEMRVAFADGQHADVGRRWREEAMRMLSRHYPPLLVSRTIAAHAGTMRGGRG